MYMYFTIYTASIKRTKRIEKFICLFHFKSLGGRRTSPIPPELCNNDCGAQLKRDGPYVWEHS